MKPQDIQTEIQQGLNLLSGQLLSLSGAQPGDRSERIQEFLTSIRSLYERAMELQYAYSVQSMEELEAIIAAKHASLNESQRAQTISIDSLIQRSPLQQDESVPETSGTDQEISKRSTTSHPSMDDLLVSAANKAAAANQLQDAVRRRKAITDIHDKFEEFPTLAARFSDKETIGKKMAGTRTQTVVAEKHRHKPVKDLKSAIGINEKFLFINQLFGGNSQFYHTSIEMLNSSGNQDAALAYLQEKVLPEYDWDPSSGPVKLFLELIERRFLS